MLATNITPGNLSQNRPQVRPTAAHILIQNPAKGFGDSARPIAIRQGGPVFIPSPTIAGILAGAVNETRGPGRDPGRTVSSSERHGGAGMRHETGITGASLAVPSPSFRPRAPHNKAPRRDRRDHQRKNEE